MTDHKKVKVGTIGKAYMQRIAPALLSPPFRPFVFTKE